VSLSVPCLFFSYFSLLYLLCLFSSLFSAPVLCPWSLFAALCSQLSARRSAGRDDKAERVAPVPVRRAVGL
jgi:hypothetical protein